MSPIPSVATAFMLSSAVPSVAPDPGLGRQPASVTSPHLLGTGGLLFAMVAIVSVAGYLYHGRGAANRPRAGNTWASLSGFLSAMRPRGPTTPTAMGTATDWTVDLEVGHPEQHVSMVYARFFHPTFWNLVECHPGTSSIPTICVEDEASEIPVSSPTPPGMNSFLTMDDDDDDENRSGDERPKRAQEEPDRASLTRVVALPPYDTSSPTNVNFSSEIIGTTVRPGAFLSIPGEQEPDNDDDEGYWSDPDLDFASLAYDGIVTGEPQSPTSARRYGMADMANLAQSLKDAIPEEGYPMVPTISRRSGLLDISDFGETDVTDFVETDTCRPLQCLKRVDDESTSTKCDIGAHDDRDHLSVPTISRQTGLLNVADFGERDVTDFGEMEAAMSCRSLQWLKRVDEEPTSTMCDIVDHSGRDYSIVPTNSFPTDLLNVKDIGEMDMAMPCRPLQLLKRANEEPASTSRGTDADNGRDSPMVPMISRRTGLLNVKDDFGEMDTAMPCRPLRCLKRTGGEPASMKCDIGVHDNRDYPMVPTISCRTVSLDVKNPGETDTGMSCRPLQWIKRVDNEPTSTKCYIGAHDRCDDSVVMDPTVFCRPLEHLQPVDDEPAGRNCDIDAHDGRDGSIEMDPTVFRQPLGRFQPVDDNPAHGDYDNGTQDSEDDLGSNVSDAETDAAAQESDDLMRQLLAELGDPDLDCSPRALSEDSDSEYHADDEEADDDEGWQTSLKSTSPIQRLNDDVSQEGPIYPLTPPLRLATSLRGARKVHEAHKRLPVLLWFNEEAQVMVMSPPYLDSPPWFQNEASDHAYRHSRSLQYGPQFPTIAPPRF